MNAAPVGGIGPVSVRYALQIRELLFAQAVDKMAAEQEAARSAADAEKAARLEAIGGASQSDEAVKVEISSPLPAAEASAPVEDTPAPPAQPAQRLVDIQA